MVPGLGGGPGWRVGVSVPPLLCRWAGCVWCGQGVLPRHTHGASTADAVRLFFKIWGVMPAALLPKEWRAARAHTPSVVRTDTQGYMGEAECQAVRVEGNGELSPPHTLQGDMRLPHRQERIGEGCVQPTSKEGGKGQQKQTCHGPLGLPPTSFEKTEGKTVPQEAGGGGGRGPKKEEETLAGTHTLSRHTHS